MRAPVLAVVSSARVAWGRAEALGRTPVLAEAGLEFDALLGVIPAAERPWLQRTAHAAASAVRGWARRVPGRAGGWGAGPGRAWCTW